MIQKAQHSGLPAMMDYERLNAGLSVVLHQFCTGETVHAYLLTGARGLGKRTFAKVLASALFCASADKPCGVCAACRRVWDGNEPDVISLFADDGKTIGVDRVREVIRAVGQHSFGDGYRVVLIEPVEKLTPQAQNCLLKSLEEPLAKVVFLLMTHELTATLGTIASRCARVKLTPWPDELMRETLATRGFDSGRVEEVLGMSGGNIGTALALVQNQKEDEDVAAFVTDALGLTGDASVLSVSTRLKEKREDAERYLAALEGMVERTLLVKAGLLPASVLNACPPAWRQGVASADEQAFGGILDAIFEARKRRTGQVNWQSTIDQLMLKLLEEQSKWRQ